MLSRNFLFNLKNLNKSLFNNSKRFFASNTNSLKSVLNEEISSEEKNYSPVDNTELTQFYQSTKFDFVESASDSTKMELKKVENNTEITIKFFSKPPMPQEDQDPNSQEEMGKENKF